MTVLNTPNFLLPYVSHIPPAIVKFYDLLCEKVPTNLLPLLIIAWILSVMNSIVCFIGAHLLEKPFNLKKRYGSWAVVTGATDGIGLAMCEEFARQGLNVVLISRTKSKLQDCEQQISSKYPNIEVKILDIDFSEITSPAVRNRIEKFLQPLDVGVLVNNVGVSYPFAKYFHELKESEVDALMTLNVDSTTWMTRIVLQGGMLNKQKGAIVNVASVAGVLPGPLLAQYGGAKGYIAQFTKCLHYELKSKGIFVQCHVPFYVATKLAKIRKASLTVASPKGYARAAVTALSAERGIIISPFWSHQLQLSLMQAMPEWLAAMVTNVSHQAIRKLGIKKEMRLAAEREVGTKKGQ